MLINALKSHCIFTQQQRANNEIQIANFSFFACTHTHINVLSSEVCQEMKIKTKSKTDVKKCFQDWIIQLCLKYCIVTLYIRSNLKCFRLEDTVKLKDLYRAFNLFTLQTPKVKRPSIPPLDPQLISSQAKFDFRKTDSLL